MHYSLQFFNMTPISTNHGADQMIEPFTHHGSTKLEYLSLKTRNKAHPNPTFA
jgi:hypothetical protein